MRIDRRPLRDQVMGILRDRIVRGQLPPGQRLDEARLVAELGVSRTPLREALLGLERETLIRNEMNRGFRVTPINGEMVKEIYPILGSLEGLALRLETDDDHRLADDLQTLNAKIRGCSAGPAAVYKLDRAWHERICRGCGNDRLIQMIEELKTVARRFDMPTKRGLANVVGSCEEHEAVMDAVYAGDRFVAAQRLEQHWMNGIDVVIAWLAEQGRLPQGGGAEGR